MDHRHDFMLTTEPVNRIEQISRSLVAPRPRGRRICECSCVLLACSLIVPGVFLNCFLMSLHSAWMSLVCSWIVPGLFLDCPWIVSGLLLGGSLDCSWSVPGLFMEKGSQLQNKLCFLVRAQSGLQAAVAHENRVFFAFFSE